MRSGSLLVALCLALVAGTAMAKTPSLRGMVEGYYGRPWSGAARRDVIRFLGERGMNAFVYGPKNDPYHRDRWRELYPDDELADLRATAVAARKARVQFIYALSPALDICYACDADFRILTGKLAQVASARVRRFALFFDDVPEGLTHPEDLAAYGDNSSEAVARAHADLTNRIDQWLRTNGLARLTFMVPTDYSGTACNPYHTELGRRLRRGLPVGWTGDAVLTPLVTRAQAVARRACVGGHPVVLWDNYPVNDVVLSNNLHLGPLTGRDPDLPGVLAGHLLNPMTQPYASLIALGTAADYLRDPRAYDAEASWRTALTTLDSGPGLAILAEQTRSSVLDLDDAAALRAIVDRVEITWSSPAWTSAVDDLDAESARQAGAPDAIAATLGGTPLGIEITPWVTELGTHAAQAAQAAQLLRAMKPSFERLTVTPTGGAVRVVGRALPPDTATVATLAPTFGSPPSAPDIGGYLRCLGNIVGPDIRLCPEYGLNVHGKGLCIIPKSLTDIQIITDRNVHRRLLTIVAASYAGWQARQNAGTAPLTLTADGTPIPLAADGSFDTVVPGRPSTLLLKTPAGDATARTP
ncbi:MAG TPA: protein O-GlcNAcase [Candidatus Binatia bacterium]|jgi:hyaluronoglucosaminidase|nr:protein O-GlcNAcase [Candidatus Binatia bacterium]